MKSMQIAAAALMAFALALRADAADEPKRNVAIAQPVAGDVLVAGRNVDLHTPVDGDVAVAGRRVVVAGPVHGYLMAAGGAVAIRGAVDDDVWAAGREVVVDGAIGDNARLAGASVVLQPSAKVGGNALLAGRRVEVRAPVANDLRVRAAQATIASDIGGTVRAHAASVKLAPGALIHGDLIAYGPVPPEIADGAKVLGQVRYRAPPSDGSGAWGGTIGWLWQWLFGFAALFVLGLAALAPSPRWSTRVAEQMRDRFGASLLAGVIALLVVPLLTLLLIASVIGIPLAVVLFALYLAVLLLSGVFVALRIGAWAQARLGRPDASRFRTLALGALLLSFVASLPWIGWLAWLLVPLLGFGALLLERRQAWRRPALA